MSKKYTTKPMGHILRDLVKQANKGHLEAQMARDIEWICLPKPEREFMWHPERKFRADFAWPAIKLLVEVDGGEWMRRGGHTTGTGKTRDCVKDAEAFILGYKTLRFTGSMVKDGSAIGYLEKLFNGHKNEITKEKAPTVSDFLKRSIKRDKKSV